MASLPPIIVVKEPPPPPPPPKPKAEYQRYRVTCDKCRCRFEFMQHHVKEGGGWGNSSPCVYGPCPRCPEQNLVIVGRTRADLAYLEWFQCRNCTSKKRVAGEGPYKDFCGDSCEVSYTRFTEELPDSYNDV